MVVGNATELPDTSNPLRPGPEVGRWSLRRWFALFTAVAALISVLAVAGGVVGIVQLSRARARLADQLDPAAQAAQSLAEAYVNQETGVRGFALGGRSEFLTPYTQGQADEGDAITRLRGLLGDRYPQASHDLDAIVAAGKRWRADYATPTMDAVRAGRTQDVVASALLGKDLFDNVRSLLDAESGYLESQRSQARDELSQAATELVWIAAGIALALLSGTATIVIGLRRGVIRPIGTLTEQVRVVAGGDFSRVVDTDGPAELAELSRDVNSMRRQIVAELQAVNEANLKLDAQSVDLRRSNAELEQFAYVASHDLQEPLRKVASFCQLLEKRYDSVLDDRGRQYIRFAVDGAVRMQTLINDLLAFSRVGRLRDETTVVDLNRVIEHAKVNLATAIEDSGATVTAEPMPILPGDGSLLTTALQNLIGNAIKFHRPDHPPRVFVTVRPDGPDWSFTVADNGIGIEPEYADRIFTIFQRLHPKGSYPGTGIGLAMCRKIIEYHGGRIWLAPPDPDAAEAGSTFCFTLPQAQQATPPRQTDRTESSLS